ncbi:hypothetical protein DXG01_011254 [Tephrocybe rancida]|nr:hypothetical protein DXG01_011254 [Tephrocybe rancida]
MPQESSRILGMESDSILDNLDSYKVYTGEGIALFGKQPHSVAYGAYRGRAPAPSARYAPYSMMARRNRVFKDFSSVPNITLNYAQLENPMTPSGSDSALSPLFSELSSPSSTDSNCYTPSLLSTPISIDLSPITSDGDFDPSPLFSHPLSPLPPDSLSFDDLSVWDVSPISPVVNLPSLQLFSDSQSPKKSISDCSTDSEGVSSPISEHVDIPDVDEQVEDDVSAKRRRCTTPLGAESAPVPPDPQDNERGPAPWRPEHTTLRNTGSKKAAAPSSSKTKSKPESHKNASPSKKIEFKLSPQMWLKLSPPSDTKSMLSPAPYPPPSPSLSSSSTPDISNPRKRRHDSLSPDRVLLTGSGHRSPSPSASDSSTKEHADDNYIARDSMTAKALSQRRSGRARRTVSYAGCDEDGDPETSARMKAKSASVKAKADRPTHSAGKSPSTTKQKHKCPFGIVCPALPFSRISDVARHLESNALHTHVERELWECENCGTRLARGDSYTRHVKLLACGKRSPSEKIKPVYSSAVEKELELIRNSDHPAILRAKERMKNAIKTLHN